MKVGSFASESCRGQGDPLWGQFSWTQGNCNAGIVGRASRGLTSRNQLSAHNQCGVSNTLSRKPARPRGCLTDGRSSSEKKLRRQHSLDSTLSRQKEKSSRSPESQRKETQEVFRLNNLRKSAWVNAHIPILDIVMGRRASDSSLQDNPGTCRPARDDRVVTAETVSKLCDAGLLAEAVQALDLLVQTDRGISKSLFYTVLRQCVVKKDVVLGSRVHAFVVRKGYQADTFLCNHILRMYASHNKLQDAMEVFDAVCEPDAFMWSSIISAHVRHGEDKQALELYHRMRRSRVKADGHVFVAALQACARGLDLKSGQQVHADIVSSTVQPHLFVWNCLVNMYAKCGSLEEAQGVFDGLCEKDIVTWTTLIAGYSQKGMGREALTLFSSMQEEGMAVPNSITFVSLLQACASVGTLALERGKQLHAQLRAAGHEDDVAVANSLVNMYAKCGSLEDAHRVFVGLGQKDVVTWTTMIAGYSHQGLGQKALCLYDAMQEEGISVPNSVTFVCLLQACASVGNLALENGKQLHAQIREGGHDADMFVANSLVNMYAKCGSLEAAQEVFDGLGQKDVVTWTVMIAGYSQQAMGSKALHFYTAMQKEGLAVPNAVTFLCLLQACASVGTPALETGKQLHAQIRRGGYLADVFVCNSLVNMYAKCGSLEDAQTLFNGLGQKDVVTWTSMIAGYAQQGMGLEALSLYSVMQEDGVAIPDSVTFVCLLQACASVGPLALEKGQQLHDQLKERGHHPDVVVANSLVNMYAKCGSLEDAQCVFDGLIEKDVVTWTVMIGGYSQQGRGLEALSLYSAMQEDGMVVPDSVTFVSLLQACACAGSPALQKGRQLHLEIKQRGHQANGFVVNSLVNMYAKCGSLEDAKRVFDGIGQKDVVAWTAMIAGYSQQGRAQEALLLYSAMEEEGVAIPDFVTFVYLLQACASMGSSALEKGKQLHEQIRERGFQAHGFVANNLVNMYARHVQAWAPPPWRRGSSLMCKSETEEFKACASVGSLALEKGKQLHAQIKGWGYQSDVVVANCLVNMYAKCGSLEDAKRVFDGLGQKDVVTWNAMITGYSQQGMWQEALCLYSAMQAGCVAVPDSVTFVSLLQACADVAALNVGRQIHAQIVEQELQLDLFVAGSLIHMYGKAGSMVDAQQVFDSLPERDVVVWNALIAGYACEGATEVVLALVKSMREDGICPNGVTFLSALTVCSHAGLVDEGWQYFETMSRQFGISPTENHYTCMVDLLGRAGQLHEALHFIKTMPILPNTAVWHTLLGACRKWNNVEVGLQAFRGAVKLDRKNVAAHVLMSNIYMGAQMWEQAEQMQARRKRIRAWKTPGQSWWTDEDGLAHSFLVGDDKHS